MMTRLIVQPQNVILWLEVVTFIFAVLLTAWSARDAIISRKQSKAGKKIYQDKDGAATEESQAEYTIFWSNVGFGIAIIGGLVVATVEVAITNETGVFNKGNWADLAVWVSGLEFVEESS
jgi:hypothetical protein